MAVLEYVASIFGIIAFAIVLVSGDELPEDCKPLEKFQKELLTDACCKFPEDPEADAEDEKIYQKCNEMLNKSPITVSVTTVAPGKDSTSEETNLGLSKTECLDECYMNISGVLNSEKKIDTVKITELYMKNYAHLDVWKSIAEPTIKKCVESAPKSVGKDAICQSGSYQFLRCLHKEFYKNCPDSQWKKSETCKIAKPLINKCFDYIFA